VRLAHAVHWHLTFGKSPVNPAASAAHVRRGRAHAPGRKPCLTASPQQVAFAQRQGILQGMALDSITVQQQRSTHYKRCCSWWSCVAWRVTDSATYAFTCIEANWKSYAADLLGLCIIPCRAAHSQALAVAAARAFICNLVVYDHSAAHAPTSAPTCLPA